MSQLRLNQLKYPDETKMGMTLLVVYMLVDATQSFSLGGWYVLKWVIGLDPGKSAVAVFQVVSMISLAGFLMLWRVRQSFRQLGLRAVEGVDQTAATEAEYLGRHIGGGKPKFFLTSNMQDTNAFCLFTGRAPLIVLGGGIRLLMRKRPETARAIVAHECAHIGAGDTLYVLAAWHLFNAYALLIAANLVLSQFWFWERVPAVFGEYERAGLGLWALVQHNARYIFRGGFPGLIALFGVALVLSHFFRAREYRADERTAQVGLRAALKGAIGTHGGSGDRSFLQRLFIFHPSPISRVKRLTAESEWGRIDLLFIAGMAFLSARIGEYVTFGNDNTSMPTAESFGEMLPQMAEMVASSWGVMVSIAIDLAIGFVITLHIYRVSSTQAKLGATLRQRLAMTFAPFAALFTGAFLGVVTSWGQIFRVTDATGSWTAVQALDSAVMGAVLTAELGAFLMISVIVAGPWIQRSRTGSTGGQVLKLTGGTLGAALVLQAVAGIAVIGIASEALGVSVPPWDIEWLPASTRQPFHGFASALQTFLFMGAGLLVLKIAAGRRSRSGARKEAQIHPTWLVDDPGSGAGVLDVGSAITQKEQR